MTDYVEPISETLTITTRRFAMKDLPVWVRIRRLDGTILKLRPGQFETPEEFAALVKAAIAIMCGELP